MKEKSKIVLVTGAAHGIGQAITEYLSQKGDFVIATDYDSEGLVKYNSNEKIHTIIMDVTNQVSIQKAASEVEKLVGGIDCIVNNAGLFIGGPLVEVDFKDFQKIFDVNVLGYLRVTQSFYQLLKSNKGRVVNMSSEVGRIAFPFNGPYSMSKYAIEAFSDSLRREFQFLDMKVVIIQPGAIRTSLPEVTLKNYQKYIENSDFQEVISRVLKVLETEKYADPIFVAKKVYKAIHKKKPKRRYKVKNNKLRGFLVYLPVSWTDFLVKNFI
ncbi:MAG: SDR family NAD(P)-dependent oxidoreductase [Candidatus Heimdallarchaeota archaeon]|nr:SDR family NAD(P)-dependent oxidoreductase [Candidatus Heimdallarchaeota archaeon]MCK5143200.1 SDR family NAD(P)-dependent oxidoreductase [Candidatus Heimdallarchaeota archaeon]